MADKRGRKNKYFSHVEPHLKEIEEWCQTMTEAQIAKRLGISQSTFSDYKNKFPELSEAIKNGRRDLIAELKSSLIMKAKGFSRMTKKAAKCRTVEYENGKRLKETEEIVYYDEEQYFPPDTAALNLALKNYDKDNWANDPQMLEVRKKELELKERQIENNEW